MKILVKVLLTILIILFIGSILIYLKGGDLLYTHAQKKVQNLSQNQWHLKASEVKVNPYLFQISARNISLEIEDSTYLQITSGQYIYPTIDIDEVVVKDIGLWDLIINNYLHINVSLKKAAVKIFSGDSSQNSFRLPTVTNPKKKQLNWLMSEILLKDSQIEYQKETTILSTGIINGSASMDSSNPLISLLNSLDISLSNSELRNTRNKTAVKTEFVHFNGLENKLTIANFNYKTLLKKYEIGHVKNQEVDWYDVKIDSVDIVNRGNISTDMVWLESINLHTLNALIFRDKRLPDPTSYKPLPHELLSELPIPIKIDSFSLFNGKITYQEHIKEAKQAGEIKFDNLKVHATNFNSQSKTYMFNLNASAWFMGNGLLEIEAQIPLATEGLPYHLTGKIHPLNAKLVNPILAHVAFAKVETGRILSSDFEFQHDEHTSTGRLSLHYENLDVRFLDPERDRGFAKIDETLMGLVANQLIIEENNLAGNGARVGQIKFKRNETKSLLNFWWKSLLSGIKSSIGVASSK